jgi:hypothetical protein
MTISIHHIAANMIKWRYSYEAYLAFNATFSLSPEEATRHLSLYPTETLQEVHTAIAELLDSNTLNWPAEQALENYLDLLPSEG